MQLQRQKPVAPAMTMSPMPKAPFHGGAKLDFSLPSTPLVPSLHDSILNGLNDLLSPSSINQELEIAADDDEEVILSIEEDDNFDDQEQPNEVLASHPMISNEAISSLPNLKSVDKMT